jgi:small subunit ribosomal protein S9
VSAQAGALRTAFPRRSSTRTPTCAPSSSGAASSRATRAFKERKKAGLKKARKRPQFSKR